MRYFLLFLLVLFFHNPNFGGMKFESFYPENANYYTYVNSDGTTRMFHRTFLDPKSLIGEGDWVGKVSNRKALIASPKIKNSTRAFLDGIPEVRNTGNKKLERVINLSDLYPSQSDINNAITSAEKFDIWAKSDRLRLFFKNPNVAATVIGSLFLFLFVAGFEVRKIVYKIIFFGLSASQAYLLVKTGSRGGFLAAVIPLILVVLFYICKVWGWKRILIGLFGLLFIGGILFLVFPTNRFTSDLLANDESNNLRVEILRAVPDMVEDSPEGVGVGNSGATYLTWYRQEDKSRIIRTLISSHITLFVELSDVWRIAYVLGWATLVLMLLLPVIKGASVLPFSIWFSLFIAGFFNPVFEAFEVWIIPIMSLIALISLRHCFTMRGLIRALALSISLSVFCLYCVKSLAESDPDEPKLFINANSVKINSQFPSTWIVGDSVVVGGWTFVGEEILDYYYNTESPKPLAYVESLDALPEHVSKLVLTGSMAEEYLKSWRSDTARYKLCKADSILLISPSVPVTEFSTDMASSGHIRAMVGSLVADYSINYNNVQIPDWVNVVRGSLLYIPGWVKISASF